MHDDLRHLANPKCGKCGGRGRYFDDEDEEWGGGSWIRCPCTLPKNRKRRKASRANKKICTSSDQSLPKETRNEEERSRA